MGKSCAQGWLIAVLALVSALPGQSWAQGGGRPTRGKDYRATLWFGRDGHENCQYCMDMLTAIHEHREGPTHPLEDVFGFGLGCNAEKAKNGNNVIKAGMTVNNSSESTYTLTVAVPRTCAQIEGCIDRMNEGFGKQANVLFKKLKGDMGPHCPVSVTFTRPSNSEMSTYKTWHDPSLPAGIKPAN